MTRRAAFFIDGSNFFKLSERLQIYAYQLEWDRLLTNLSYGRSIEYAHYYHAQKNQFEDPDQ